MSTLEERQRIARAILNFEARRDRRGRLQIYTLPRGDGGGRFEVAGVTERHHPSEAHHLAQLIKTGHYDEAEQLAIEFIAASTDGVTGWQYRASCWRSRSCTVSNNSRCPVDGKSM
jgi:hypothetical protein